MMMDEHKQNENF